ATTPTEHSTLSLHDALPISIFHPVHGIVLPQMRPPLVRIAMLPVMGWHQQVFVLRLHLFHPSSLLVFFVRNIEIIDIYSLYVYRSEEHTSELQSRENLVCRL